MNPNQFTDSAGVPWEGRSFDENNWKNDSGETPKELQRAFETFEENLDLAALVRQIAKSRFLIPLVASLGEGEIGPHGQLVEKSADLAIVAVATPDGQSAIPAFSSVSEMTKWRNDARPVPVGATKLALAAISEGHNRIVINPASNALVLRAPALRAIAQEKNWTPSYLDPAVEQLISNAAGNFPEITALQIGPGDPKANLAGAELLLELTIVPGLEISKLESVLTEFANQMQTQEFLQAVDSVAINLRTS